MNKFLTLFFVTLIGFGLVVHDADARRMGGARSIGKQRQMAPAPQRAAPAAAPAPAPAGAAPARNKWLGPLAGLAAGGLLASMFMGGGLGGGMGNILMILALVAGVFLIVRLLRKPQPQQPVQYAGYGENTVLRMMGTEAGASAPAVAPLAASTRPAWFEDEPFLREAKIQFLRLQDANDRGDINDIHEYVTPEMYAELRMQIQERNGKPNKTDVVTLNAEIADVVTEGDMVIASVRFSGMIREEENAPAETFSEIWHIQKSLSQANATWFISGIQQV
jgi:predicted lipid-binding transport protein (Tim44 family)